MTLSTRLTQLGLTVPTLSTPFGAYVPARLEGKLLFVAGQLPMKEGQLLASGVVPQTCSIETAQLGARQCVLNALSAAQWLLGSVDRLAGVVRVGAFVCATPDFTQHPTVANAASQLLLELFGDAGRHARSAVGAVSLPLGAAVEIEFIFSAD